MQAEVDATRITAALLVPSQEADADRFVWCSALCSSPAGALSHWWPPFASFAFLHSVCRRRWRSCSLWVNSSFSSFCNFCILSGLPARGQPPHTRARCTFLLFSLPPVQGLAANRPSWLLPALGAATRDRLSCFAAQLLGLWPPCPERTRRLRGSVGALPRICTCTAGSWQPAVLVLVAFAFAFAALLWPRGFSERLNYLAWTPQLTVGPDYQSSPRPRPSPLSPLPSPSLSPVVAIPTSPARRPLSCAGLSPRLWAPSPLTLQAGIEARGCGRGPLRRMLSLTWALGPAGGFHPSGPWHRQSPCASGCLGAIA